MIFTADTCKCAGSRSSTGHPTQIANVQPPSHGLPQGILLSGQGSMPYAMRLDPPNSNKPGNQVHRGLAAFLQIYLSRAYLKGT